ncbi:J domain-containing protein [Streptomyces albofaciens JCM 4342]|uniref:J domain-containing protein n=1 Tax=Streptomyces albofaciens TaxID=66866 RepID=UPI00123BA941|nr:J domain-containing protein [Streptomyces albofaciens]KAA6212023.1 J domain-containing protein [Streptomyces albofaciens JCM 4342]
MRDRHRTTNLTDLYAVLGVHPSVTAEMITSAFRARVRELRPDTRVDTDTAERYGRLRAAYDTLRDPGLRAAYDREHTVPAPTPAPTPAPPVHRVVAVRVDGGVPPEPPLRVGPVRWERRA